MNEDAYKFTKLLDNIICLSVGFILGAILGYVSKSNNTNVNPTYITTIDSLKKVNDSIKFKVEKLDSIKDAKVIEVSTLDNDSTLKLFYKLVSE